MKSKQHPTTSRTSTAKTGFTDDEKAAMKERARELKAAATNADGENDLLAKIAEMPALDRAMAKRVHAVIKASAPVLTSKNLVWHACVCSGRQRNLLL